MKTTAVACVCLCLTSGMLAGETRVPLTGFEATDTVRLNSNRNIRIAVVTAVAGERLPEGRGYLQVTMGGVNDAAGGWVSFALPEALRRADAKALTLWLRGAEDNRYGPVLIIGGGERQYFCWKGRRNTSQAQLPVGDGAWAKYEFRLADFVPHHADQDPQKLQGLLGQQQLRLELGRATVYAESITFAVDHIEVVCEE